MKKFLIISAIALGVVLLAIYFPPPDGIFRGDKEIKTVEAEYITAPENNTYKIGVQNYQAILNRNITADTPLKYQLDDKYIAFKPIEIRWDESTIKTVQDKQAVIDEKKYYYKDALGTGIDIDMNFGNRIFEKVVKINSLKDLGTIPKDVKYLEIEYEVATNFIIDGWNKKDDFEITETVRLGDFSYIEPAMAWDSYREESCEQIPVYDDTDTIIEEYVEGCETLTNRVQIKSVLSEDNGKLYLTKQIPVDWLKSAEYPIYTDTDVAYGNASPFEDGSTVQINVEEIDTGKFVVCYNDDTDGDAGKCVVTTFSGDSIDEWGAINEYAYDTGGIDDKHTSGVVKLDTNDFAVCYTHDGLADDGYNRVGVVSTTTIGYGTQDEFYNGDSEYMDCAPLGTDKFIIVFNNEPDGDDLWYIVETVSGDAIETGTAVEIEATNFQNIRCEQLDTDAVACTYASIDETDIYARVGTVSGTTATFGDDVLLDGDTGVVYELSSIGVLGTEEIVIAYCDGTSGQVTAATVSGNEITLGEPTEFESGGVHASAIEQLDSTHFLIAYSDNGDSDKGKSVYCTVVWETKSILCNEPEVWEDNAVGSNNLSNHEIEIDKIGTNKVVICYRDTTDSGKGKCIIGNTPSAEPPAAEEDPPIIIITD